MTTMSRCVVLAISLVLCLTTARPVVGVNPYAQLFDVPRAFLTPAVISENSTCPAPGTLKSIDPQYASVATFTNIAACAQPYEAICRAPSGAVHCNTRDAKCIVSQRSSGSLYPALNTKGSGDIEQCVSEGEYTHPEANVVLVAQSVVSFVVIVICAVLVLIRTWQHLSLFMRIWFIFMMIVCILLLPSFYYLNGLIGVAASILAVTMFATRKSTPIALGMTACIAAMMWFTFDSGLGYLNHTVRLRDNTAGDSANPLSETLCDRYYRFSYHIPLSVLMDDTNSQNPTNGVCLRGWLSTVLFFSVFLIISLMILAVAGAHALTTRYAPATKPPSMKSFKA